MTGSFLCLLSGGPWGPLKLQLLKLEGVVTTAPEKRTPGDAQSCPGPHGPIRASSFAKKSQDKSLLLRSLPCSPLPEREAPASALTVLTGPSASQLPLAPQNQPFPAAGPQECVHMQPLMPSQGTDLFSLPPFGRQIKNNNSQHSNSHPLRANQNGQMGNITLPLVSLRSGRHWCVCA